MNLLHARALRALGWTRIKERITQQEDGWTNPTSSRVFIDPATPSEAELIGLLLLELDRLTTGNFVYYGPRWFGAYPIEEYQVEVGTIIGSFGGTSLEALVLAVEAAKEGK